jgi:phosphatidate phosphatase LPIN
VLIYSEPKKRNSKHSGNFLHFSDDFPADCQRRANLITFERLCSDPAVIYNPNLMVLYQDLFYPGKAALPLIMSYLAFGKPLSSSALEKFQISTPISLVPSPPAKSGFLHRWFGQDAVIREAKLSETKLSDVKPILADPPVEEIPAASRRTLRPTCEMLKLLNLHRGPNLISFCVESALQGPQIVEGYIYLWTESARIVISDVDGTITRSV